MVGRKIDTTVKDQSIIVGKAIKAIGNELTFTSWWPKETVEKYFNYVYTIGFTYGMKQSAHEKEVLQIQNGKVIQEFSSATKAAHAVGVTKHSISKAALGKTGKVAGFEWKYK